MVGLKIKPENIPVQFINNAAIDGKTRKLICSHAAKGKNVGKKRIAKQKEFDQSVWTSAPSYRYSFRAVDRLLVSES
jgi:hypothetical protein